MNQSQPKFKKGDCIIVYTTVLSDDERERKPIKLEVINVFYDYFHGWCYVLKSGDRFLTIAEDHLIEFFDVRVTA